jgi:hypothetical protein
MARIESIEPQHGQTVWLGVAVLEDGRRVRFAGDWRPLRDIAAALEAGEEVEAEIPIWAELGPA